MICRLACKVLWWVYLATGVESLLGVIFLQACSKAGRAAACLQLAHYDACTRDTSLVVAVIVGDRDQAVVL